MNTSWAGYLMVGAMYLGMALTYGKFWAGVPLREYRVRDWCVLVLLFVLLWPVVTVFLIKHLVWAIKRWER